MALPRNRGSVVADANACTPTRNDARRRRRAARGVRGDASSSGATRSRALHGLRAAGDERELGNDVRGVEQAPGRPAELGAASARAGTPGGAAVTRPAVRSARCARSARRLASASRRERGHTGRPLGRICASAHRPLARSSSRARTTGAASARAPGATRRGRSPASARRPRSPGTARRSPRRSATSTASAPATRSSSRCPTARSPTACCGTRSSTTATGRSCARCGYDQLVLSACHPLYSADQRYVVFARSELKLPGARRRRARRATCTATRR